MATEPRAPSGATILNEDKRTYSVPEIAKILKISKSKAYELCKTSDFKTVNIGKAVRVSKKSFDSWLDGNIE
jgi:excisionase family DNA binding protein